LANRLFQGNNMKLRITPNSLRLRVSQSDLAHLMNSGRIEETIQFAADRAAKLTYALEQSESEAEISVVYRTQAVTLVIPVSAARDWAKGDCVGIYGSAMVGEHQLALIVEKDFACLEHTDRDNIDTFPNPKSGTSC
jgi:hypothetical protein